MTDTLVSPAPVPPPAPVIDCAAYCGGARVADLGIDQIRPALAQRRSVRLARPVRARAGAAADRSSSSSACTTSRSRTRYNAHQRPKLELYEDSVFVVLRTAQRVQRRRADWSSARRTSSSAATTSSPSGTARCARTSACASAARRRRSCWRKGPGYVLYALMDFVVDQYLPIVAADRGGSAGPRGRRSSAIRRERRHGRASTSSSATCCRSAARCRRWSTSATG